MMVQEAAIDARNLTTVAREVVIQGSCCTYNRHSRNPPPMLMPTPDVICSLGAIKVNTAALAVVKAVSDQSITATTNNALFTAGKAVVNTKEEFEAALDRGNAAVELASQAADAKEVYRARLNDHSTYDGCVV